MIRKIDPARYVSREPIFLDMAKGAYHNSFGVYDKITGRMTGIGVVDSGDRKSGNTCAVIFGDKTFPSLREAIEAYEDRASCREQATGGS